MENLELNAYEYIKFLGQTEIKSKAFDNGDGNTIQIEGRNSVMNRYALFSYLGSSSINTKNVTIEENNSNTNVNQSNATGLSPDLEQALSAALSTRDTSNISQNPIAANIINYFGNNPHNSVEYDWADFLYCKWYGKISNNYMITLRRFPFAVEDNIFNKAITPNPDIARVISFWGEGTDNSLNNVLGFTTGYNWKEITAEIQVISSQKIGNPFKGKLGGGLDALSRAQNPSAAITKDNERLRTGNDFNDPIEIDGFYANKILGPVNVIDKMNIRDRGLNYTQEISFVAEYRLKSYGGISPKEAMLDIMANLLTMGYSNAPFWGGAVRYKTDNRTSTLLGDQSKLLSGDYVGYLKSVGGDLSNTFSNVFGDSSGEFSFSSIIGGLLDMGKGLMSKFITNKLSDSGAVPNYQVVNALLTGESTGEWHITVGNPLNPIAVMGNLILSDMSISFDETLGSEDFPLGIKAEFKLKPARPRDKTDIENMFNLGQGRLYYVPANKGDILNIAGKETYNYGVVNGAKKPNDEKNTDYKKALTLKEMSGQETQVAESIQNRFKNHGTNEILNTLRFHSVNENILNKTEDK